MTDMTAVIAPKSDQLNSDDLIAGPRTIRVRDIDVRPGTEQPVSVFYEGDGGKPWKPCKSMSRVLVSAWGPDAKAYVGRSATLYRDPSVTWGGMAVGGIRVSHMSHIDREFSIALTATKKTRAITKVLPLKADVSNLPTAADARAAIDAADTLDDLRDVRAKFGAAPWWGDIVRELNARRKEIEKASPDQPTPGASPAAGAADPSSSVEPVATENGRDDADHGEAFTTVDAEADIMAHLDRKVTAVDVNSLVSSRIAELDEDGQDRLRTAAMNKIAELKAGAA